MNLVVFDLDGTLTGTSAIDETCFVQAVAETFGITKMDTDWSGYENPTDAGIARAVLEKHLGRPPESGELSKLTARFFGLLDEGYKAGNGSFDEIPGAASLLRRLRTDARWGIAIATGSWELSAQFKIRVAGLPAGGIPAAFAEDGPSREAIVRTAMARAAEHYRQHAFEKTISVGDAVWDVRTARRLGLPFVGIGNGERAEMLRAAGARIVVENFLDNRHCLRCFEEAGIPGHNHSGTEAMA